METGLSAPAITPCPTSPISGLSYLLATYLSCTLVCRSVLSRCSSQHTCSDLVCIQVESSLLELGPASESAVSGPTPPATPRDNTPRVGLPLSPKLVTPEMYRQENHPTKLEVQQRVGSRAQQRQVQMSTKAEVQQRVGARVLKQQALEGETDLVATMQHDIRSAVEARAVDKT